MDELPSPDKQQPSPPWVWAAVVALALVVITGGAIVGMVTTSGDENSPEAAPVGTGDGAATAGTETPTAPLVPPTVSIPPLTEPPADTGSFETFPPEPIPPLTIPPPVTGTFDTWPSGQSGYTVILASVPEGQGRAQADSAAQRAIAAGLQAVGVLRSGDFASLQPGFWVAYSGVYASLPEAQAGLPQARSAGFQSAYTRQISP